MPPWHLVLNRMKQYVVFFFFDVFLILFSQKVYSIFGPILGHHLIEAFSFGVVLNRALGIKIWWAIVFFILTYASLLPLGIGVGMGLSTQIQSVGFQLVQGFIIAVAAGAFMYVAIFEVLIGHNHFGEDDEEEAITATAEAVIFAEEHTKKTMHNHRYNEIASPNTSEHCDSSSSVGSCVNNESCTDNCNTNKCADSIHTTIELEDKQHSNGNNTQEASHQHHHQQSIHSITTNIIAHKMHRKRSDNDVETTAEKILLMVRFALFGLGFAIMSIVAIWV